MKKFLSIFSFLLIILISSCLNDNEKEIRSLIVANDAVMKMHELMDERAEQSFNVVMIDYALHPRQGMKEARDKSVIIKNKSDSLISFIHELKLNLIKAVSEKSLNEIKQLEKKAYREGCSFLENIDGLDNCKTPDLMLFGSNGKGIELIEQKINTYVSELSSMVEPTNLKKISIDLGFNKSEYKDAMLAADVLLLNSLVIKIRETESDVILFLYDMAFTEQPWSKLRQEAIVTAKNNYIKQGEIYEAKIMVALYDQKQQPKITIHKSPDSHLINKFNRDTIIEGNEGFGVYRIVANNPGWNSYSGFIEVVGQDGNIEKLPFNATYFVEAKQK
ncbi:hypothetical protein SDC9_67359 [bioreactor metagenome]|uniref:Uncharacterized protein n=1 Tax=bioreactor metagenome TaxID=1076179 RepID=A0A644XZ44_9ZZZZ